MANDNFKIGVLTLSDKGSRGEREDVSGTVVRDLVKSLGSVVRYQVIPDDAETIELTLCRWADEVGLDLILTTGGTGLTARDVTPQATARILDYEIPGMAEAMRAESLKKTPHAMLSRALAGVRSSSLIVNLPGSPKAAKENLEVLLSALPHALGKLKGDTSDCAISEEPVKLDSHS